MSPGARPRSAPPEEDLFGERASRLEPRALLAGRTPAAVEPGRVDVAFLLLELTPAERAALGGVAGGELEPGSDEGLARWRGPRSGLARVARGEPGLLPLLRAWDGPARPPGPPRVVGVVNVTPDSFSDGGRFLDPAAALARGAALAAAGADLLEVGGESTRPGSQGVSEEVELGRVLPVVTALCQAGLPVAVDTRRSAVAEAALDAGARVVNDVTAGRGDARMFPLCAEREATLVLMHMRGTPRDMQERPSYADPVREVLVFLRERAGRALAAGIAPRRLVVDPGIGFGKRLEDNLALLRGLPELRSLGLPVLLGVSRKSFLHRLGASERPDERVLETAAAVTAGALFGAELHRVHAVDEARAVLRVAAALSRQESAAGPSSDSSQSGSWST